MSDHKPQTAPGTIYGSKVKLVQVAKRSLAMDDTDYRAMLMRVAGVTSSKALTLEGFERVMVEFNRLGFTSEAPKRKPRGAGGSAPNRPNNRQWRLIEDRARRCGFDGLDDPRFINWVKPRGKVEHPRFLDIDGAQRVIAALGNWIARKGTP